VHIVSQDSQAFAFFSNFAHEPAYYGALDFLTRWRVNNCLHGIVERLGCRLRQAGWFAPATNRRQAIRWKLN